MSRARILADYVSSGDELALKAPLASPAFTGTPTGITGTHITSGTLGNTVQDNITRLGTVTAGNLSNTAIVYPNGHIIQIEFGETQTQTTCNDSSWTTATNLNVDITPTDPTNKILVTLHMNYQFNNSGLGIKIYRDSTQIRVFNSYSNYTSSGGQVNGRSSYSVLDDISDSPAWSSGVITYSIKGQAFSGSASHINESSANWSEIIAMEVVV